MTTAPLPEALATTHAAAFADERPWSAGEFATLLEDRATVFVGDARSFVIGRVMADEAEVLTLATHPEARRAGHARAALAAFEDAARARGAARVFLEVAEDNAAARALYDAAGYGEAGRRPGYYSRQDGSRINALILSKALAD